MTTSRASLLDMVHPSPRQILKLDGYIALTGLTKPNLDQLYGPARLQSYQQKPVFNFFFVFFLFFFFFSETGIEFRFPTLTFDDQCCSNDANASTRRVKRSNLPVIGPKRLKPRSCPLSRGGTRHKRPIIERKQQKD